MTCTATLDGKHHYDFRQLGDPRTGQRVMKELACKCGKRPRNATAVKTALKSFEASVIDQRREDRLLVGRNDDPLPGQGQLAI